MGDETRPRGWRFTDGTTVFRLFPEQRRLFAGDKEVRISQRAFDLLVFLVENPGRPLGKQEIMKGAWRGMTLADSSLSTHVWTLRKIIGTTPITVINSFGYQFTPEVEPAEDLPALPRPTRPLIDLPRRSAAGIGRESELAELVTLAGNTDQHPILTIVGGGGIGKTWLAIELGWRLTEHFPDGIHVIDLAQARTPAAVASAAGRALDVPLRGGDAPAQILAAAIGQRRMLLIFDACEYAAGPAGEFIGALLVRAPKLSVLVTSQQQLRIPNETVFRLQPLPQDDAVKLFVQSAGAADRRFQTTPPNAASVADICRRLDGNPLMLEIAAALVPSLGVEAVREGLDQQRFAMLDSRPRNAEPRQRTLSAIVEWSCGLLDAADRQVFRRLACFAGGFTTDAAVAVTATNGATKWDILACLDRLVDKSLLVFDGGDPERYHLVETLALHAKAKLEASGETERIAERHARYYTDLFLRADEAWETLLNDEWLIVYGLDIDNVRTALDWTLRDPNRLSIAVALAGAAGHLWERLALPAEGRRYLDRLAVLINNDASPADAARLLRRAGTLWRGADRLQAVALTERSLAIYRRIDDRLNLGSTLAFLGNDYVFLGRHDEAKIVLDEARDLLTGTSFTKSLWAVMNDLGSLALFTDNTDEARRCYVIATDLARSSPSISLA
jgi:predicted ATPase